MLQVPYTPRTALFVQNHSLLINTTSLFNNDGESL